MAANLMKPDYFKKPPLKNNSDTTSSFLIPPSVFEKPSATSARALKIAEQEIEKLRRENEELRCSKFQQVHQPAAGVVLSQSDYVDELIKRQANEITELKSEICKARQLYEQESTRWMKDMKALQDNSEMELNRMEKQSKLREEEFEQNIDRLSRELQRSLEENESQTSHMREKLETTKITLDSEVQELKSELNSVKRDADKKIQELEGETRQKSNALEEKAILITQLKTYIGQSQQKQQPAQLWKTEKETVENQLKIEQAENKKLQSHLELLEVRFKALNEILSLQEGELSKTKGGNKTKQHSAVITRWREKVFALLVQQKSSELVYKNELNQAKQQIHSLEETLKSNIAKQEILKHSLTEKTAQLQIEIQDKERLELELAQTQEVAICLDDQNKDQGSSIRSLVEFAANTETKYKLTMKALEEKVALFKTLCQRITFASSRMDMLKTQMIRKTAMSTPVEMGDDSRKSISRSRADEDMSRDSEEHLYQELERVMRERDSLATQVRNDSSKWTQKMTETRTVYQSEIFTLKKTVEELESDIQQKSRTCAQLTEELETLKEETQENQDTIAQLQAELARHARGVEGVLTDLRLKDDEIYSEKITDLQRKLNESKREHAKTVVSLRQLERSRTRELERGKELLGTTEEKFSYQVQQLQTRLKSVEKERNIMMATLRQEGLLSKLRSDRKEPVWLQLEEEEIDDANGPVSNLLTGENKESGLIQDVEPEIMSARGPSEPVESVLQDLKSLSAAIFDDPDSEEDNNSHDT